MVEPAAAFARETGAQTGFEVLSGCLYIYWRPKIVISGDESKSYFDDAELQIVLAPGT